MRNATEQSYFDYTCSAWYSNLTQSLKKKLQIMQSKCIHFCITLDKICTISHEEFKDFNWLPVNTRLEQYVISIMFKLFNGNYPYLKEVFEIAPEGKGSLKKKFLKFKWPFQRVGQKALSFISPSFWNQTPETRKKPNNLNTFKHNLKKHFFNHIT